MAGDFRFSTSEAGYYGPDFRLYPERWWDDPVRPTGWPDISVSSALLTQIDQVEPLGKKSCRLTSSLNALIVRGLLEPADAERIQQQVVTSEDFEGYWLPSDNEAYRGFTTHPHHFAFILSRAFDTRIGVEFIESASVVEIGRASCRERVLVQV